MTEQKNKQPSALLAGTVMLGDFHINRIGYGAMRITGAGIWGEPENREEAERVLLRACELDVNFIDTADAYGPEVSEKIIADVLRPYEGIVVATKGGITRNGPGSWIPDCRPQHLRQACEKSLQRLGVERIDLYQLHTVDPKVAFEDSFQALLDLQKEGKIRYIGLSNIEPMHFKRAIEMGNFVSVQNNYNILNREHEDVLKLCEAYNIVFIPYFPMGGNQVGGLAHGQLTTMAAKYKASPRQIGLAWLIAHSPITLPIPGTSSIQHLEENVAAAAIKLDTLDLKQLDSLV
jgi:aryl-alcohol dehydrogenase-like predicted oxidoreductase